MSLCVLWNVFEELVGVCCPLPRSLLHAVWCVLPLPLLCCPYTLFLSPHQTSPHALCSLDLCALNRYAPIGPSFLSSPSFYPQPRPFFVLLHLHLLSMLPSLSVSLCLRASLQLLRSGAWCWGRGMCPRLEVPSVVNNQTHIHNLCFLFEGNSNIMVWRQMAASSHHLLNNLTSHLAWRSCHRARCMCVLCMCVCRG